MANRYSRNLSASLYIRNVSERARYEDLKRLFSRYGKIVDITVPLDYYTRDSKGYAFVEFEEARDAEEALYALDHYRLLGRELEVEFARGDRKTPSEMRSREKESRYNGSNGRGGAFRRDYDRGKERHTSRSRSRSRDRRVKSYSRERSLGNKKRSSRSGSRGKERSRTPRRPSSRSHSKSASPVFKSRGRRVSHSASPADA
ncbi:unnamed protein product [Didymodactylos carnosus]|uniref:RRM domain-containing protein n=1 Tax=Didymodactylos carnosus TaxID=1234261 RepID=A0A814WCE3_9BILA|nr:unnamed protein product [Didymodactylos carnosus]CAF1200505.1 unnamed protein product [Didymodactylos carnosus]CAF3965013.1 unnamed protein product [Didymodactylos carnosus]CAF3999303.1 unnamed protein product [Didymodactylos carnosus]